MKNTSLTAQQVLLLIALAILLLLSTVKVHALRIEQFLEEQCKAEYSGSACHLQRSVCLNNIHTVASKSEFFSPSNFKTPSRFAVFSINIPFNYEGSKYTFFVGLTAKMWSRKDLGYVPLVVFVVEYNENCEISPKQTQVLNFLKKKVTEAQGLYLIINQRQLSTGGSSNSEGQQIHDTFKQFQSATIAQVSRIVVSALPFDETDYILTADADIWPLSAQWFLDHATDKTKNESQMVIMYGDEFAEPVWKKPGEQKWMPMYAICYLGASARNWRTIMQINVPAEGHEELLEKTPATNALFVSKLSEGLNKAKTIFSDFDFSYTAIASMQWYLDQLLVHNQIVTNWREKFGKDKLYIKGRNTGADRIDRSSWPVYPYTAGIPQEIQANLRYDSHLLRPGDTPSNWPQLRDLIDYTLYKLSAEEKKDFMQWVERYYTEWVQLVQ